MAAHTHSSAAPRTGGSDSILHWLRRGLLAVGALFAALVVAIAALFGYFEYQGQQTVTLPAPTGSYQVGRATYQWTDQGRQDPFSPSGHAAVTLSVWAWYPAQVPHGARRAAYMPPLWAKAENSLLQTEPQDTRAHSWSDVPVAATDHPLPVLVFMPGFGKVAADYTTLLEDLASRGYVVFAVSPPYISDDVVLGSRIVPENRRLHMDAEDPPNAKAMHAADTRVVSVEAADLQFVLDRVTTLDGGPAGRFAGRLTTARAGLLGHSIGGAAALQACSVDVRCVGAANLDGSMAGSVVVHGIHKPFLYLGEDPSMAPLPTAQLRGVAQGLPADDVHVFTVTGAGHMNFSDLGAIWKFPPGQFGSIGPIDGARALAITRAYLAAFFTPELRIRSS